MANQQDDQNVRPQPALPEEDYEHLLEDYSHFAPPAEGELLEGRVLKVTENEVIVDFGTNRRAWYPSRSACRRMARFWSSRRHDRRDDRPDRPGAGRLRAAFARQATRIRSWDNLEKAHREGLLVSGRVVGRVKGGLSVDVGVKAFMPSSQVMCGRYTTWRF